MEIGLTHTKLQESCIASKTFEKARQLFNRIGVRNTTMNDLAKELGISKKTLYKEIDNKADLVKLCVTYDLDKIENKIKKISSSCENAIEELLQIETVINEDIKLYHPAILQDLNKFYPECSILIENHKNIFAQNNVIANLKKGIQQGLYREDINIELATTIQLHLSLLPFEIENKNYNTIEIYLEILKYNIYAIATPKGIEQFKLLHEKYKN